MKFLLSLCLFLSISLAVFAQSSEPAQDVAAGVQSTIAVEQVNVDQGVALSTDSEHSVHINDVYIPAASSLQVVPEPMELPEMVVSVAKYIIAMPKIGPVAVSILKWLAIIVSIFNGLIAAFFIIVKIPEIALRMVGLVAFADKLKAFYDKIYPYLAWPSILNSKLGIKK